MSARFKVEGMAELKAQLERLKPATGRAALTRAGLRALQPTVALARRLAPEDTGELANSIVASARSTGSKIGDAEFSAVMAAGGTRQQGVAAIRDARRAARGERGRLFVDLYVGPRAGRTKDEEIKALIMEFGTATREPQPYLRPAFAMDAEAIFLRLKQDLGDEIRKALARAAKRAARAGG